jgi:hypothetical protein
MLRCSPDRRSGCAPRRRLRAAAAAAIAAGALAAVGPAAAASGSVVYVGDSLGVGTTPYLQRELGSVQVHGDSKVSRPSQAGPGILRQQLAPGDKVVVFDLGTNDDAAAPGRLQADLEAAAGIAGNRCMVVATINKPGPVEGLNSAVRSFEAGRPGTQVVDWRGAVRSDPSMLAGDGVHGTGTGYAVRGRLFADAVRACLAGGGAAPPPREPGPRPTLRGGPSLGVDLSGLTLLFGEPRPIGYLQAAVVELRAAFRHLRAAVSKVPEPVLGK